MTKIQDSRINIKIVSHHTQLLDKLVNIDTQRLVELV